MIWRISFAALLLSILPFFFWLSGWQWQPHDMVSGLKYYFFVTESAGYPWAAVTSVFLALWFIWRLKLGIRGAVWVGLLLAGTIISGQLVKSVMKKQIAETRPYVSWLASIGKLDLTQFEAQNKTDKKQQINQVLIEYSFLPNWLKQHWQYEVDFSFPSGHEMFSASWALLGVLLLWPRRHYFDVVVLSIWAVLVAASRLTLGMHWPQDLIASIAISWLLVLICGFTIQKGRMGVQLTGSNSF